MGDYFWEFDHIPQPKTTATHRPRVRRPGPPPGQDFDTLTKLHGRPRGAFEEERVSPYKATEPQR